MKRLILVMVLAALASACIHPWVGRPVAKLEKEYGSPLSVVKRGDQQVYYYPDFLAGRGQMTFTVDKKGIIRSWCATNDVPGVFGDDPFGIGDGGFGTSPNINNPNQNPNPNPPSLGGARAGAGLRGLSSRGLGPSNCQ